MRNHNCLILAVLLVIPALCSLNACGNQSDKTGESAVPSESKSEVSTTDAQAETTQTTVTTTTTEITVTETAATETTTLSSEATYTSEIIQPIQQSAVNQGEQYTPADVPASPQSNENVQSDLAPGANTHSGANTPSEKVAAMRSRQTMRREYNEQTNTSYSYTNLRLSMPKYWGDPNYIFSLVVFNAQENAFPKTALMIIPEDSDYVSAEAFISDKDQYVQSEIDYYNETGDSGHVLETPAEEVSFAQMRGIYYQDTCTDTSYNNILNLSTYVILYNEESGSLIKISLLEVESSPYNYTADFWEMLNNMERIGT